MHPFFRVSNRCHDGLLFMGKLAARHASGTPLTVDEAAGSHLSAGYLEQIVAPLREAGLIAGKRGPGGGYLLTRSPVAISVREVIEALEGKIGLVDCQAGACVAASACGSKHLWRTLQERVAATFDGVTVADIAEKEPSHVR